MSDNRQGGHRQLTMEQRAVLAAKLEGEKEYPKLGPKRRATHIMFYSFYGALTVSWATGFYDWAIRNPNVDMAVSTLACVIFMWGIWDFATNDGKG